MFEGGYRGGGQIFGQDNELLTRERERETISPEGRCVNQSCVQVDHTTAANDIFAAILSKSARNLLLIHMQLQYLSHSNILWENPLEHMWASVGSFDPICNMQNEFVLILFFPFLYFQSRVIDLFLIWFAACSAPGEQWEALTI